MKTIKDLKKIKGRKVLVRVDFNVPIKDEKIVDDFRIKAAIKTITYLQKSGAIVILMAHLGDDGSNSLEPIFLKLKKLVSGVRFIKSNVLSDETKGIVDSMKPGEVALLENIRRDDGEKKNLPSFARGLSRLAEFYVNDAFSVSHRAHASTVGITKYLPSFAGFQLVDEVNNLSKAFNPKHPFLFILGGSKFETKIPLIKKFLKTADNVFIGGAIANDFIKAKGYEVGTSLVGGDNSQIKSFLKIKNLILPTDVVVENNGKSRNVNIDEVKSDECILDIGKDSVKKLEELVSHSKFILWNGPLGKYESGFGGATENVLKAISKSKALSIVGGGDTVALITKLRLKDKIGFVSTGGGATLDFLATGTLPGIKALK